LDRGLEKFGKPGVSGLVERFHGVALEASDFYWFAVVAVHYAGAFAEDVYRAYTGTA
jgi:hypothetical protein